jgi:hypothetical protein
MTRSLVLLLGLAACGSDDPCEGLTTCIQVDVSSDTVERIDHLELDIQYGEHHAATTTTPSGGGTVDLPLSTAVEFDTTTPLEVGIVAAGKLSGNVLGTGAASTTIEPDARTTLRIVLGPVADCQNGGRYCGGDSLAGDPDTVYTCNTGGAPVSRGKCLGTCRTRPGADDICVAANGPCIEGGLYCGGDKVDGDPSTLYRCTGGVGVVVKECAKGCVIAPSMHDDDCR